MSEIFVIHSPMTVYCSEFWNLDLMKYSCLLIVFSSVFLLLGIKEWENICLDFKCSWKYLQYSSLLITEIFKNQLYIRCSKNINRLLLFVTWLEILSYMPFEYLVVVKLLNYKVCISVFAALSPLSKYFFSKIFH